METVERSKSSSSTGQLFYLFIIKLTSDWFILLLRAPGICSLDYNKLRNCLTFHHPVIILIGAIFESNNGPLRDTPMLPSASILGIGVFSKWLSLFIVHSIGLD